MLNFYIEAVKNGKLTIDQVAAKYRDDVKKALGLDEEEPVVAED